MFTLFVDIFLSNYAHTHTHDRIFIIVGNLVEANEFQRKTKIGKQNKETKTANPNLKTRSNSKLITVPRIHPLAFRSLDAWNRNERPSFIFAIPHSSGENQRKTMNGSIDFYVLQHIEWDIYYTMMCVWIKQKKKSLRSLFAKSIELCCFGCCCCSCRFHYFCLSDYGTRYGK